MPTVKTTYTPGWDAGAISIARLDGDGGYTWHVGQSIGVCCGLNNNRTSNHYSDITYGFFVEDNRYRIIESGTFRTSFSTFDKASIFKVQRVEGVVTYHIDDELVYTSGRISRETVFLDCSLYYYGDEILEAAIFHFDSEINATLPALQSFGSDADVSVLSAGLPALHAYAAESETSEIDATLPALIVFALVEDAVILNATLPALTVRMELVGVEYSTLHITLPRIQAKAWESFARPELHATLPALQALAVEEETDYIAVGLPSLAVEMYVGMPRYFMMEMPQFEMVFEQTTIPDPVDAEVVNWDTSAIYYRCTLTGTADGLPDIVLPISSFQTRARKNPRPSYLSVIVPNATLHLPYIIARPNGEIVIEQGRMYPDGIEYDDLVRADYENFAYNEGARNSSITLTGHRTLPVTVPQIVDLRGVSIQAQQQTGIRRVTAAVDFRARPGDTVKWDGNEMTAGMIAIAVGRRTATMTVTEETT